MGTKRVAPWQLTRRRQAVVDHRLMLEAALGEAFECWDAGQECVHRHLPADSTPAYDCFCWAGLHVREAEALKLDVENLKSELVDVSARLDSALTMLDTLKGMIARVDTNVTAVGYQVSQNGR